MATLPKLLAASTEASKKAASELLDAAKALNAAGKAHDYAGVDKGVENVHTMHQALESQFA